MAIKLTSTIERLKAEGKVNRIPAEEYSLIMEHFQQEMESFEIEFRAMQAESEQIASEVYLTF